MALFKMASQMDSSKTMGGRMPETEYVAFMGILGVLEAKFEPWPQQINYGGLNPQQLFRGITYRF